jgi:hypothetical protein
MSGSASSSATLRPFDAKDRAMRMSVKIAARSTSTQLLPIKM